MAWVSFLWCGGIEGPESASTYEDDIRGLVRSGGCRRVRCVDAEILITICQGTEDKVTVCQIIPLLLSEPMLDLSSPS